MSIAGNLRTMPFGDRLQWLAASHKTGTLVINGPRYNKKVYLKDGDVVAVASDNPRELLGYYLVGWGFLTEEELREAVVNQRRTRTMLGELLVSEGVLTQEEMAYLIRVKIEESIYDLMLWKEGDFRLLDRQLPDRALLSVTIPVDHLLFEGARQRDERLRAREVVPGSQHIPVLLGETPARTTNEDEMAIVSLIDGASSIEQIALSCRLPEFAVISFVYRAIMDDAVRLNPPSEESAATPGLSDAAWHEVAEEIFERLQQGRLLDAFKMHATLLEKYSSNRDAVVVASRIEEEIGKQLDDGPLAPEASLEPAFDLRQIMTLECDPAEGFVLSRITGRYTVAEILRQLPGPELQNRVLLHNLVTRGLVKVRQATGMAVFERREDEDEEPDMSAALSAE